MGEKEHIAKAPLGYPGGAIFVVFNDDYDFDQLNFSPAAPISFMTWLFQSLLEGIKTTPEKSPGISTPSLIMTMHDKYFIVVKRCFMLFTFRGMYVIFNVFFQYNCLSFN